MKNKQPFYVLTILFTFLLSSCGNNTKEKTSNVESEEGTEQIQKKNNDTDIIYSLKGDCESFYKTIDYSSLCFSEKDYDENNINTNAIGRCQFDFLEGQIKVSIIHKDYANFDSEKIEMDKLLTKGAFQKTAKRLYKSTKQIDELGDDAFIAYQSIPNGDDVKLGILLNNVTVSIIVEKKSCASSDDELIKFGKLIIEQIKK